MSPYFQSCAADVAKPWATPAGCLCWNWLQIGIAIMRRAGFVDIWLHDEILFVPRST